MFTYFVIQARLLNTVYTNFWSDLGFTPNKEEAIAALKFLDSINDHSIFRVIEVQSEKECSGTLHLVNKYTYSNQDIPVETLAVSTNKESEEIYNTLPKDMFCTSNPIRRWDIGRRNWQGGMYDNWA